MTTASLDAALGNVERLLLDTSAMISYHNRTEAVHPLAKHLLSRIEDDSDPLEGYLSWVYLGEHV